MVRRLVKDAFIVIGGTLTLLLLCATVGINNSTPPNPPIANAAQDTETLVKDRDCGGAPFSGPGKEQTSQHLLDP
jgi:hypothetical protein